MRMKTLFSTLLLLGALSIPALGTTVPRMDLPALVKTSDRIVQGKVENVETRIDRDNRQPFTWVRIRVDDPMKGDRRSTIFIKYLGGIVQTPRGPAVVSVAGMPKFEVGENVILFLKSSRDGETHAVNGLGQGKFVVLDETAISNVSGADIIDSKTGKAVPAFTESAPVEVLKAKIRELLK